MYIHADFNYLTMYGYDAKRLFEFLLMLRIHLLQYEDGLCMHSHMCMWSFCASKRVQKQCFFFRSSTADGTSDTLAQLQPLPPSSTSHHPSASTAVERYNTSRTGAQPTVAQVSGGRGEWVVSGGQPSVHVQYA